MFDFTKGSGYYVTKVLTKEEYNEIVRIVPEKNVRHEFLQYPEGLGLPVTVAFSEPHLPKEEGVSFHAFVLWGNGVTSEDAIISYEETIILIKEALKAEKEKYLKELEVGTYKPPSLQATCDIVRKSTVADTMMSSWISEALKKGCTITHKTAKKNDDGKLKYHLIPYEVLEELAKVLTFGAEKYGENNWQKLEDFDNRYYSARCRHEAAIRSGEKMDPESKLLHASHVLTGAAFAVWKARQELKEASVE